MAIDLAGLRTEYDSRKGVLTELEREAIFALERAIQTAGIKYHSVTSRLKTFDSFCGKIERRQTEKPFEDITDLVGVRVICLFLSDVENIAEVIRSCFAIDSEDNKIEGQPVSSFGYMSFHFIARMKKAYSGPRYDAIAGLAFEIQVRTIAMEAWATASHYLDYKTDKDVPKDLKKDFYALSGLFYVADRHFEMFYRSREQSLERIERTIEAEATSPDQELNLDALTAYLKKRFPDRVHSDIASVSELVSELSSAGIKSIQEIDEGINRGWKAFAQYEQDRPPARTIDNRYLDIGIVRIIFSIINDKYLSVRKDKHTGLGDHYRHYQKLLAN